MKARKGNGPALGTNINLYNRGVSNLGEWQVYNGYQRRSGNNVGGNGSGGGYRTYNDQMKFLRQIGWMEEQSNRTNNRLGSHNAPQNNDNLKSENHTPF